jgi:WD40 repeat protein
VTTSDDREKADVFDFVDAYLSDVERGVERPLQEWLACFPLSQDAIAREWLLLRAAEPEDHATRHEITSIVDTAETVASGAGQRVGAYRLLRELGRGGQGAVWLAEDTRIARRVALKLLASRFDSFDQEALARFRREAEVIARLEHPSLCTIYEADVDGKVPYIAMRFVEGRTLSDLLAEAKQKGRAEAVGLAFPPRSTLEVHALLLFFERAARALHAAHEAGVVHRDVKPGNLIAAKDGRPVLLDFGLARDESDESSAITRSGDVFGTPAYMSPEQLALSSDHLDRRTDIYSLGMALYESLTLLRPFEKPSRAAMYAAIATQPTPDPRSANAALSDDVKVVLETALEKDRARRYATALDLAEDLRRIREYEPIHARPASVPLRFARWTQRHPALAVAIIGTIVSLGTGLAVSLNLLAATEAALQVALGEKLAQRSLALVDDDPSAALALGIEAVERTPDNYLARSALLPALDACWLSRELEGEGKAKFTTDIALSPDGERTLVSFDDGSTIAWDTSSGKRLARFECGAGAVQKLAFSPDGVHFASASSDGVRVFDNVTGSCSRIDCGGEASWVEFAPDGGAMLVVARKGNTIIMDAASGARRCTLDTRPGEITRASFAPDCVLVLASGANSQPSIFDRRSGKRICDLAAGKRCPWSGLETLSGSLCAVVATFEGTVEFFDPMTGAEQRAGLHFDHTPTSVSVSPDGKHLCVLASRAEEGWAYLCDLDSGRTLRLEGHDGRCASAAAFSPDGTRLATAAFDNTIRIWNASTGAQLRRFTFPWRQLDMRWCRDGRRLVTRTSAGFAHIWYTIARPDTFDLEGHTDAVRCASFSADGSRALTGSDDGTARLWSVPSRSGEKRDPGESIAVMRHGAPLVRAEFSSDGSTVLTLASDGSAGTWSAASGAPLRSMLLLPSAIVAGAIDARGERAACVCADGYARVFATRREDPPVILEGVTARLTCIRFSDDGRILAIGTREDEVRVHDAQSGALLRKIGFTSHDTERAGIVDVAFRPGKNEIAAACGDKRLRLWNATSGDAARDELFAFEFKGFAFSRDGAHILATGPFGGGAVRSIDVASGKALFPQNHHHTDTLTSACYSPDGALVLTTSKDRSAFVWLSKNGAPVVHRTGFSSAVLCGALGTDGASFRAITGCEDGRACVWPVDPLPAALARKPRELQGWEKDRERRLALPLEYR